MNKRPNKTIDIGIVILLLLSLANVLNLFVPRNAEDADYILRLPVQMVSGLVSVLIVIYSFGYIKTYLKRLLITIYIFCGVIFLYLTYYIFFTTVDNGILFSTLKFVTWLLAIPFFAKVSSKNNPKINWYIKLFIITFILAATKKVFESAKFDDEKLPAGDTAGLTLVLAIPAILLYYKKTAKILLTVITIFLVFATIRRTAILCLVVSFPFLFKEFRSSINKKYILMFVILLIFSSYISWTYFGDAVETRFSTLLSGDNSYQTDSYGSGRNIFWALVFFGYLKSSTLNIIIGNGIGTVSALLKKEYYDIHHVHDDILEVLYTYGLVGLSIWLYIMKQLIKLRKGVRLIAKQYLNVYYISIFSFVVVSIGSGSFYRIETLIFSLTVGKLLAIVTQANKEQKMLLDQANANEEQQKLFITA